MGRSETFSIRQMIELTGLSEFTIRGWENRYSAFEPRRGETGRRGYTKTDVERALLLRELLKRGHRIGQIASLSNQKLQSLFEHTDMETDRPHSKATLVEQVMECVALQKWGELEEVMNEARAKSPHDLVRNFFLPILKCLSGGVESQRLSIAQEHVLSAFLKEKIYSTLAQADSAKKRGATARKARFVLATPEGDHHELGLLLAHLLIRSAGLTSLYLGPHTPARELGETALRFRATHVLVVSTIAKNGGARQDLMSYVSALQKRFGSNVKVLMAGSQSRLLPQDPTSSLFYLGSFQTLEEYLRNLGGKS